MYKIICKTTTSLILKTVEGKPGKKCCSQLIQQFHKELENPMLKINGKKQNLKYFKHHNSVFLGL